ncbi:cytochrome-b5 reductase [Exophiala viscosa]|uniref:cytochrome-b5 reductase n=1 Tax=Exophiala viscosa TaxID=2486360 RepID=UPI0021905AD3|nr:cytochrome-b5 reductase [Exophiala viscosa]
MGWFAIAFCTLLAGFVLYRFLVRENAIELKGIAVLQETSSPSESQEERSTATQTAPKMTQETSSNGIPTLFETPPLPTKVVEPESVNKARPSQPTVSVPEQPTSTKPPSPPRLKPPTIGRMPAPPRPGNGALRPPPSAAASLRVPSTKVLSNASMAPSSSIMPPGKQVSRKVILEPGHSPLDWAALTSSPNSQLRGKDVPDNLIRVTPAQLKQQNGRKGRDAWTVYQGKVYNITPYVPFHPGGKGEILRGAGKDSVQLFMEVHPWVNWDGMLSECLVGILVNDEDEADSKSGGLDEMD